MYYRYSLQHTSFFTAINIHVDHLLKRKQQCINLKHLNSEPQSYNHQKINKYILWNYHCSSTINVYEIPWEFRDKYMYQQTCYKDMNCLKCVTNQTSYTKKSCSNKMYNFGYPQTFKSTILQYMLSLKCVLKETYSRYFISSLGGRPVDPMRTSSSFKHSVLQAASYQQRNRQTELHEINKLYIQFYDHH